VLLLFVHSDGAASQTVPQGASSDFSFSKIVLSNTAQISSKNTSFALIASLAYLTHFPAITSVGIGTVVTHVI
jgi:hypothetical protein